MMDSVDRILGAHFANLMSLAGSVVSQAEGKEE
jgi:hypothetical protein